jgi:hypothetical protein
VLLMINFLVDRVHDEFRASHAKKGSEVPPDTHLMILLNH